MKPENRTVLVFGTFDILHPGHKWFLRHSGQYGDHLVAAVARDSFVSEWKGHAPMVDEASRMKALESSGLVDGVCLSDEKVRTYGVVSQVDPDVICLGHDQKALKDDLEHWLSRREGPLPEIVVLPPWHRNQYSSSRRNQVRGAGNTSPWILYAVMFLAMGTFGFSWVSGKRIAGAAHPATLAFIRFAITSLCFLPAVFIRRKTRPEPGLLSGIAWTLLGAAALSAYNILFFMGLDAGLAGQGGLIVTTLNPLFTFMIVSIAGRKVPGKNGFRGVLLGIAGGIILLRPWSYSTGELADSWNLLFLAAALCWSVLTVVSRKGQEKLGFNRFNLVLYLAASVLMFLAMAISGTAGHPTEWIIPTDFFWFHMLFISVATGAFGTGAYFLASSRLGAARGSAFTYLVPVFALVFTAFILQEVPDPLMILGGAVAIVSVVIINRPQGDSSS